MAYRVHPWIILNLYPVQDICFSCSIQMFSECCLVEEIGRTRIKPLAIGWRFSPGSLVFSTNKTDRHDITEILLKVALNIKQHSLNIALLDTDTCRLQLMLNVKLISGQQTLKWTRKKQTLFNQSAQLYNTVEAKSNSIDVLRSKHMLTNGTDENTDKAINCQVE